MGSGDVQCERTLERRAQLDCLNSAPCRVGEVGGWGVGGQDRRTLPPGGKAKFCKKGRS